MKTIYDFQILSAFDTMNRLQSALERASAAAPSAELTLAKRYAQILHQEMVRMFTASVQAEPASEITEAAP